MGSISLQIPVIGQPASTEDPKIASNFGVIQTAINGDLDTTNLSATAGIVPGQITGILACTISRPTRSVGTAYQPNTTRPTFVLLTANVPGGTGLTVSVGASAGTVASVGQVASGAAGQFIPVSFMVEAGWWYEATGTGNIQSVTEWTF